MPGGLADGVAGAVGDVVGDADGLCELEGPVPLELGCPVGADVHAVSVIATAMTVMTMEVLRRDMD